MFHKLIATPIGSLLVKSNGIAVNNIEFIDTEEGITPTLENPLLVEVEKQIVSYFKGELKSFSFPFEQEGTGFQQRVWQSLEEIPFGKTINYRDLSIRLGDPKCIRAAAAANGRNKLAIVVPCHRVVGSDGGLVGYAWELHRKQWLLGHEAKFSGKVFQTTFW